MIGNELAKLSGMIKTTTLEDLLGPQEDEIPDFSGMIARKEAGGQDGMSFARDSDRRAVLENLMPVAKTIRKASFEPVLLEIAVIHDPRLVEEKRRIVSDQRINTFFVSDVVSFLDRKPDNLLLHAWDLSIKGLLNINEKIHEVPVPIVTNQQTYGQALYQIDLSAILEEACATREDGSSVLEDPGWPEWPEVSDQTFIHSSRRREPLSNSLNETNPDAWEPVGFRRAYDFDWTDDQNKPERSIRFLARRFVYHIMRSCAQRSQGDALVQETCAQIRAALSEAHLLVIPFKRPLAIGSITPGKNNAEPGGCVFAIIRQRDRLTPNRSVTDEGIRDLSMRLTWLLAHSALAEAYSELALKDDRDYFAAVATHHLPTVLRELQHNVGRSRDEIRRESTTSPALGKALGFMEEALRMSSRLVTTAGMFNKAQKARDSGLAQFPQSFEIPAFIEALSGEFNENWKQAMEPFKAASERLDVILDKTQISIETLRLPSHSFIKTDMECVSFVILELFRNALRHGDYSQTKVVFAKLIPNLESDGRFVVLEVANPVSTSLSVNTVRSSRSSKIGLSSLEAFTNAFGVPRPRFERTADGLLNVQIAVGKVQV